jgi:hypothetical protein
MSQAGIVDIEGSHPQIPTVFVTNSGSAIPIANTLEILGNAVAAHSIPLQTVASGNTVNINVQYASASATSMASKAGIASFNSADFSVDSTGFVTLSGSAVTEFIAVDTSTPPGTNPVAPNSIGVITVTGGQVAAGTTSNVIQTNSLAVNTYTIQIQRSQAVASSTPGDNGVSHFSSSQFGVDANGFVTLTGGSGPSILSVALQAGTTPITPSSGIITFNGATVAAGTTPVHTNGTGAHTMALQVQLSQAIAAADATKVGLAAFSSTFFTVDINGFVSINGSGVGETITGTIGSALAPSSGNWNILGSSTAAGTAPVQTSGSGSTLTVQVQKAQAIASTDATKVGLATFDSARFTVDANGFVSLNSSGDLETLSDDVGTSITPSSGNIQLVGHVVEQGATKFSTVVAGTHLVNINPMSPARWIVDSLGFNGTHTTIPSAIASASAGDTIFVLPGTYSAPFTMIAGISIAAFTGDEDDPNVIVTGKVTCTYSGSSTISNICFQAVSDYSIVNSGSNATVLYLESCSMQAVSNTSVSFTNSNSASAIYFDDGYGSTGTTGVTHIISSSAGTVTFTKVLFSNVGASTTASSFSAGTVIIRRCAFAIPVTTSGTATLNITNSTLYCNAINTIALTGGGSGGGNVYGNYIDGGSASAVSIGTGAALNLCNNTIYSTNTNAITGLGIINHGGNVYVSSSNINTTTQNPISIGPAVSVIQNIPGVSTSLTVSNTDNTNTNSYAKIFLATGGSSGGSPVVRNNITGVTNWTYGVSNSVTSPSADPWVISVGTDITTSPVLIAYTGGQISKPLEPSFSAYLSTTQSNVTGDTTLYTVVCDTVVYDQNSNYTSGSGTFTAPITGKYLFIAKPSLNSLTTAVTNIIIQLTTTSTNYRQTLSEAVGTITTYRLPFSTIAVMTAGDTAIFQVEVDGTTKTIGLTGGAASTTIFQGNLLC